MRGDFRLNVFGLCSGALRIPVANRKYVPGAFLVYPALNRILDQLFDRDVFLPGDFLAFSSSGAGMPINSVEMRFTPHYLRH